MIRVNSVIYRYTQGLDPIIDDVSFTVEPGQLVAIMGANGSGKSTLARLLNGLLCPESGSITVDELCTTEERDIWEIRAKVGMVFQNPDNQLVAPTVEDDVAFGLENLCIEGKEIRERVKKVLTLLKLERYAQRPPDQLSGGEKQRVAIAGILAMEPKYLILDEASSMLDPSARKDLLRIVHGLQAQGLGIIMVTQHPEEVTSADHLIVLNRGKVVMQGTPQEVLCNKHQDLQKYGLDTTPMGRLAARLRSRGCQLPKTCLTLEEMVSAL